MKVLTSPGLDSLDNMREAVDDFRWPPQITSLPDSDGSLWSHFGVRLRGTWVLVDRDGQVFHRTAPHPPDLLRHLDRFVSSPNQPA